MQLLCFRLSNWGCYIISSYCLSSVTVDCYYGCHCTTCTLICDIQIHIYTCACDLLARRHSVSTRNIEYKSISIWLAAAFSLSAACLKYTVRVEVKVVVRAAKDPKRNYDVCITLCERARTHTEHVMR